MKKTIIKGIVFGLTSIITMLISGVLIVKAMTALNNVEKGETLTAEIVNGIVDRVNEIDVLSESNKTNIDTKLLEELPYFYAAAGTCGSWDANGGVPRFGGVCSNGEVNQSYHNGYDSNNGLFTVPLGGVYKFCIGHYNKGSTARAYNPVINNNVKTNIHINRGRKNNGHEDIGGHCYIQRLEEGDVFNFEERNGYSSYNSQHAHMYGYLISY